MVAEEVDDSVAEQVSDFAELVVVSGVELDDIFADIFISELGEFILSFGVSEVAGKKEYINIFEIFFSSVLDQVVVISEFFS